MTHPAKILNIAKIDEMKELFAMYKKETGKTVAVIANIFQNYPLRSGGAEATQLPWKSPYLRCWNQLELNAQCLVIDIKLLWPAQVDSVYKCC